MKLKIGKYISPEEKRKQRIAEDYDYKFHFSNWHEFFAIFPRKIIADGIVYYAVGKMWRRGEWVFKSRTECNVYYGWRWEYTDVEAVTIVPQREPNPECHGGKRVV